MQRGVRNHQRAARPDHGLGDPFRTKTRCFKENLPLPREGHPRTPALPVFAEQMDVYPIRAGVPHQMPAHCLEHLVEIQRGRDLRGHFLKGAELGDPLLRFLVKPGVVERQADVIRQRSKDRLILGDENVGMSRENRQEANDHILHTKRDDDHRADRIGPFRRKGQILFLPQRIPNPRHRILSDSPGKGARQRPDAALHKILGEPSRRGRDLQPGWIQADSENRRPIAHHLLDGHPDCGLKYLFRAQRGG
ncbi:hypothetical protein HRbin22_01939 [Candidatus Thermoflexus japonica]|uniref:Uncharacterized protein n=1 Tax=Candidatus Thermoflexus japonica TaxID=2035417 RepID=A0A2H5Y8E8_9CHLR|nr:hypothetical protein HRbin22_01939 [Candidatus Thermoflexus japonica]